MILIPAQSAVNFLPNSIFMGLSYASGSNDEEEDITITDTFEPPPDDNSGSGDSNSGSGDSNSGSGDSNSGSGDSNSGSGDSNSIDQTLGHDNSGDSNSGSGDDNSGKQKSAQHEATEVGTVYVKVNNPYGNGLKPGDFTLKIRIEGSGSASPKSFPGDSHGY